MVGGHPPFGYRYLHGEGRLEVDEREAAIVRQILELLVSEKLTTRRLMVRLNELGVPTPAAVRGGKGGKWNKSSAARILRQEAYIGKAHYNKSKRVKPKRRLSNRAYAHNERASNVRRPQSEWVVIPVDPIVSQELWDQVQAQLRRNTELHSRNVKYQHLLRGFVFCGKCNLRWYSLPSHGKRLDRAASD
ncbi:MAG: recombinase family protein [Planctomycetes bacterium]|nr:recombinase family protein [Planctomycetota bacterium]